MSESPYEAPLNDYAASAIVASPVCKPLWGRVLSIVLAIAVGSSFGFDTFNLVACATPDLAYWNLLIRSWYRLVPMTHPITSVWVFVSMVMFRGVAPGTSIGFLSLSATFSWFAEWFFYGWLFDTLIYRRRLKNAVKVARLV